MFARQINDFETHTYAIPGTTFLSSSNLLLKIKQENNSLFGIFLSFYFFFEELIPSFCFWFFFNKYNKIKCTPTLAFWYIPYKPKRKNIRSHYHRLANINKTRVKWCGWTKETANEWSVQKGFLKFVFRWMVNIWPWCSTNALIISNSSQINKMFQVVFEQVLGSKLMNCAHMKNE